MKYVKCFIGENVRKGYKHNQIPKRNWRITHDKIYEVVSIVKPNVVNIKCDDNSIGSFTISESCGRADFIFMDATVEVRDNIINDILNYD